ncbi:hypothetical protein [Mesonia sp. HuA40]|uniref:hypothetical protein n=1 Tax=Mesonia sp. HuA40 TaxID=2602761 RepID=UPI0011C92E6D|nr:hypothetical protein [Mesonia sp. HuA40]TXK73530.1 hypothetical protein FT993_04245 [Mesonia sp. HuA40]
MRKLAIYYCKVLILSFFGLTTTALVAQKTTLLHEKLEVNAKPSLDLESRHTRVIIETWNQNRTVIEAYIEGVDLSDEQVEQIKKLWGVSFKADKDRIFLRSFARPAQQIAYELQKATLNSETAADYPKPGEMKLMKNLLAELNALNITSSALQKISKLKFDYSAYQKQGKEYLRAYENLVLSFLEDKENAAVLQRQSELQKNAANQTWRQELERKMQQMEAQFNERITAWSMSENNSNTHLKKEVVEHPDGRKTTQIFMVSTLSPNANKAPEKALIVPIVKVKIPSQSSIKIKQRYGALNLEKPVSNLQVQLAYASLKADRIIGENNRVEVAYAPVNINFWEHGELHINYVKQAEIGKVKSMALRANASDLSIEEWNGFGRLTSTFGQLKILKIGADFNRLDMNLSNTDLSIAMPKLAFELNYTGSKSNLKLPSNIKVTRDNTYGTELVTGFFKDKTTDNRINIDVKFSKVVFN